MVFGTLTENVGYEYVEETTVEDAVTTPGEDVTTEKVTLPIKGDKTTAEETTEAPKSETTDNTTNTGDDDEKKGGCGATAGIGFAVIASVSAAAMLVVKRRKED
jgi:hypothetical protein